MSAAGGDEPPKDEEGLHRLRPQPPRLDVAEVIERAEPLGTIATYRRTENRWRHYERMERPLDGFLAVGDALRAFNPLYGQGISTAALAAEALDRCLGAHPGRRDLAGFTAHAQPELVKASAGAWLIATGVDLRYPTVKGDTRPRRAHATPWSCGTWTGWPRPPPTARWSTPPCSTRSPCWRSPGR